MRVTVCIPTLNEAEGIGPTLNSINRDAFARLGLEVDLVVVDGASKDDTKKLAEAAGAVVITDARKGYGRAYKTGFAAATGDIIVTGDADGTYPFDACHHYVQQLLDEGLDFITCDRYGDLQPGAMSGKHRLGNWALSATTRALFGLKLRDSQSGMWIIRREALERIPYASLPDGMAFSQEIKVEAFKRQDVKALEIPSQLRPRIGEPVIETWRDGFGNLMALWKKRFNTRWSR